MKSALCAAVWIAAALAFGAGTEKPATPTRPAPATALEVRLHAASWDGLEASNTLSEIRDIGLWKGASVTLNGEAPPLLGIVRLNPNRSERLRIVSNVRKKNWYHAFALEHELIGVTTAFEMLHLEWNFSRYRRGAAEYLDAMPLLAYHSGNFDGVVEVKNMKMVIPLLNGKRQEGCMAFHSGEALPARMLRDAGYPDSDAFVVCWE
jgi:hypothetical protein